MRYLALLRIKQYYKNLVIFLPIVFGRAFMQPDALILTVLGFVSFCLMSSVGYIINDIIDRREDLHHPEKKQRPIASGRVSISAALAIASVLFIISVFIAVQLSPLFLTLVFVLFTITQLYTFWLKHVAFVDALTIGTLFFTRAVAGAFVITHNLKPYLSVSPWFVLCTFFLSLFLTFGKRQADQTFLRQKAVKHKGVFVTYNKDVTRALTLIATVLLIVSYSLYSFLSQYHTLFLTLPVALYVIFRYYFLIESGSPISRHPELFYTDRGLMIGVLVWGLLILLFIYMLPAALSSALAIGTG
ncbi:UbiA prenyltransferase family protein [Candidatus Woesearchaeota archaeon]|nr:UbiA prenyltransferase family protein [Candidatus Woesearchaeota archaeon]